MPSRREKIDQVLSRQSLRFILKTGIHIMAFPDTILSTHWIGQAHWVDSTHGAAQCLDMVHQRHTLKCIPQQNLWMCRGLPSRSNNTYAEKE